MTTVGYFHNGTAGVGGMPGAPNLSGTAGALIAVLDACLVDGWGSGTVDSVVISGGIATVTRAAGCPFDVDSVAEIAGAATTGGSINGRQKVLTAGASSYTFATALANQTATGTITHKVASLGWAKTFSGTNLAVYRSADVAGTRAYLRVDDTGTTNARWVAYETMSDVNTGSAPFPTNAQQSGGLLVAKSGAADSSTRDWVLVGDSRSFNLNVRYQVSTTQFVVTSSFGDFSSNKASDSAACQISAGATSYVASTSNTADLAYVEQNGATAGAFLERGVSGVGGSVALRRTAYSPFGVAGSYSGATGSNYAVYPNPAANEILLSPLLIGESGGGGHVLRGAYSGAYFIPQAVGANISSRDRITGVSGFSGRAFRALATLNGAMLVDVTGPWAR